jgi:hypothetical protein
MPESLTRKKRPPTTARVAGFKSEWWPDLFRNGGRLQIGIPAGFKSVHPAGLNRNPHNCEEYARAILGRIGGPSFEQLMIRETAAPKDGGHPPRDPNTYYFAVRELFPHVAEDNDVVGRLVLFTMLAGTLRLEGTRL